MTDGLAFRCNCRDDSGLKLGDACPRKGERGHGKWYPRISYIDGNGKRRQPTLGGYPTRTAAKQAREQELAKLRGGFELDRRQTTGEWLELWLSEKRKLRATTRRSYRQHMDLYLLPNLGQVRLDSLRASHISRMIDVMTVGTERLHPGPATIQRVHATLRSALNSAVKQQRITINPALHVELPDAPRPRVQPWSPAELGAFLDAVASDRLGPLYECLAFSGLRRGEALGLRWQDVDLEHEVITVVQQLVDDGGHLSFDRPKTSSGEFRRVDLDSGTAATLLEWRLRQDAERTKWGDAYADSGLVFCRENGHPLRPEYVTRRMQTLAKAAGLPRKRLHDLRHGSASLQVAAGVPS